MTNVFSSLKVITRLCLRCRLSLFNIVTAQGLNPLSPLYTNIQIIIVCIRRTCNLAQKKRAHHKIHLVKVFFYAINLIIITFQKLLITTDFSLACSFIKLSP